MKKSYFFTIDCYLCKSTFQEIGVKMDYMEHGHVHKHTLFDELMCHFPYAVFSVAFCLIVLSFVGFFTLGNTDPQIVKKGAKMLCHSFHFMHIVFAATGVIITFFRYSDNLIKGIIVGVLTASFFCTLSDSILPYLGMLALGVNLKLHLCFLSEIRNVVPFLVIGIINGLVMSKHRKEWQSTYSVFSHFFHIFISSLASSFYLLAQGFTDWYKHIGFVFLSFSMGQILCSLMIAAGFFLYFYLQRREKA